MAQKRFITSAMGADGRIEAAAELDQVAALMWPWMLTSFDDWGRLDITDLTALRLEIFPAFAGITRKTVLEAVDIFVEVGLLHRYTQDDRSYLAIRPSSWKKWQTYLQGSKRAATCSSCPVPNDAPWPRSEDDSLTFWLTKPSERSQILSADNHPMSADVRRQSRLSVPSPSPTSILISDSPKGGNRERKTTSKDPPFFTEFYAAYPRKIARPRAAAAFAKLRPNEELLARMLEAIDQQKQTDQWQRDGGQFIPHPATWLNNRRWEDETTPVPSPAGNESAFAEKEVHY